MLKTTFPLWNLRDNVFNLVTEVIAKPNARVQYGAVDHLDKGITTYVNRRGITERDARIGWSLGLMNDGNTVSENTTNLIGDGSSADAKSLWLGVANKRKTLQQKLSISEKIQ